MEEEERKQLVDHIVQSRKNLLNVDLPHRTGTVKLDGQLLFFAPGLSLWDGGSHVYTNGFFGGADEPPWDTWVCYIEDDEEYNRPKNLTQRTSYLISWIPALFVEVAEEGVNASMGGSLFWFDEIDSAFTRLIGSAGFP
jgi:hypothetical protein